jgi:hypothetical protein
MAPMFNSRAALRLLAPEAHVEANPPPRLPEVPGARVALLTGRRATPSVPRARRPIRFASSPGHSTWSLPAWSAATEACPSADGTRQPGQRWRGSIRAKPAAGTQAPRRRRGGSNGQAVSTRPDIWWIGDRSGLWVFGEV